MNQIDMGCRGPEFGSHDASWGWAPGGQDRHVIHSDSRRGREEIDKPPGSNRRTEQLGIEIQGRILEHLKD